MKIIYIPVTKKISDNNLKNLFKCFSFNILTILKNFLKNKKVTKNTQGYIDSALHSNANVFELPYNYCIFFSWILNLFFDGVFVNFKFTNNRKDLGNINFKLMKLSKKFNIKKVIVDTRDISNSIIDHKILANYDYVIKSHKHKSIKNKNYFTTMLPLRLIDYRISKENELINWSDIGKSKPNNSFKFDVFFSGTPNNERRKEAVELLSNSNLNFYGHLKKLPFNEYIDCIYNSSINLAIAGVGGAEFTFRHLEILSCCSFLMCHEEINEIELPLPIKDGIHYVTFKNKEDMLSKIKFFLTKSDLRAKIALNGRRVLEDYYSPKKHGMEILSKIFS